MNIKELASKLAFAEGKKISVSIGNVREVLSLLSDEAAKDPEVLEVILKNGMRRKKPRKKSRR